MVKEEKNTQKAGVTSKVKGLFSQKGDWKIPAAAGIVTAILFGGPFGLGVAGGVYSAAKLKGGVGGPVTGTKDFALKAIGGMTSGACTVAGAAIGSMFFPLVGTVIGAGVGFVAGMFASKKVTEKVRDKYIDKAEAKVEGAVKETTKAVRDIAKGKGVSPDKTPGKKKETKKGRGK